MACDTRVKIVAICGSLRRSSSNGALLEAAAILAPPGVHMSSYRGLGELPAFNPDVDDQGAPETVRTFRTVLDSADAVLISSPEYAHGIPGALKNALDWLVGSGELIQKPVGVIIASSHATHAWASLVETLTTMSASVVADASVTIPVQGRGLDRDGIAADPELSARLSAAIAALADAACREAIRR